MADCLKWQIAGAVLTVWGLLSTGCTLRNRQTDDNLHVKTVLPAEAMALLREGDIILRQGEGMLSRFIVRQLGDTVDISHCGILVREKDGWQVIHCLSLEVSDTDGVQRCSLDDFMSDCVAGSLYVVRCMADTLGCLVSRARYYLGAHKTFDHGFSLNDTTSFFCSELPYRILKDELHIEMSPPSVFLKFSSFFDPEHFRLVCRGVVSQQPNVEKSVQPLP